MKLEYFERNIEEMSHLMADLQFDFYVNGIS